MCRGCEVGESVSFERAALHLSPAYLLCAVCSSFHSETLAVDAPVFRCRCDVWALLDQNRGDERDEREFFLGSPGWVLMLHQSAARLTLGLPLCTKATDANTGSSELCPAAQSTSRQPLISWLILGSCRLFPRCCTSVW